MNFDALVVKESPGLCRCCLSEGCYKDLGTEYSWMNETEVYADMLLECFDISISQNTDGPNGCSRLICEVCITRLRDACNFKKQVLDSEKRFIDMVAKGEFNAKMIMYQAPMKCEEVTTEDSAEVEYLEEIDYEDDLPLKQVLESAEVTMAEDAIINEPVKVKGKRGRPRKVTAVVEKKAKLTQEKPRTSKSESKAPGRTIVPMRTSFGGVVISPAYPRGSLTARDKRSILRKNVIQVVINSTAMPFRWLRSSYRCFYCYDIFQEATDLKQHQNVHVDDEAKIKVINNYWEHIVYIDISNLSCKHCVEYVADLYDLIDHLASKHSIEYNKEVNSMVAFKLENQNVNCLSCGLNFYTFGHLLHHTNKDHKGTSPILCDICGQHFKDNILLRVHVKTVHNNTGLLCTECGDKFETRSKLFTHQKNTHDMQKKFKCLACPLYFESRYKRSRHMSSEHNRKGIKCLHCPKTFVFRSMMMSHLRESHLKVKNYMCSVCGWKGFTSNRLKNHMVKHSGEKNFKCDGCDKNFSTKKVMRAHFARVHKDVQSQTVAYDSAFMGQ